MTNPIVAGCHCEKCEHERTLERRRRKLGQLGRPQLVTPAELAQVRSRIRDFHQRGMSSEAMSEVTGLATPTILQQLGGNCRSQRPNGMRRGTFDKLMAMPYVADHETRGKHGGARMNPIGSVRRIEALAERGYSLSWISKEAGLVNLYASRLLMENCEYVSYRVHSAIRDVYEKYRDVDPLDLGHDRSAVQRRRSMSRRKGFPGPWCWDDDTMDEPMTFAQWTGVCGTWEGVLAHERVGMLRVVPIAWCRPCRQLRSDDRERQKRERKAGIAPSGKIGRPRRVVEP
jgi:hypothetical protein